jgi:hypothetical protein
VRRARTGPTRQSMGRDSGARPRRRHHRHAPPPTGPTRARSTLRSAPQKSWFARLSHRNVSPRREWATQGLHRVARVLDHATRAERPPRQGRQCPLGGRPFTSQPRALDPPDMTTLAPSTGRAGHARLTSPGAQCPACASSPRVGTPRASIGFAPRRLCRRSAIGPPAACTLRARPLHRHGRSGDTGQAAHRTSTGAQRLRSRADSSRPLAFRVDALWVLE